MQPEPFAHHPSPAPSSAAIMQENQNVTLQNIRSLVEAGVENIVVWGLSGTGKSVIEKQLKSDLRLEIISDCIPRRHMERTGISFKTGIPAWLGTADAPSGEIYHAGFDCQAVLAFGRLESRTHMAPAMRSDDEHLQIAKMLEQLGLGSATFFAGLTKVSSLYSYAGEIACQFTGHCRRGGHPDPLAAFVKLTETAPADLSFIDQRAELIAEVSRELRLYLDRCGYSDPTSLVSDFDFPDLIAFNIAGSIFGTDPLPEFSRTTLDWYRDIPVEVIRREETCFAVRSLNPLDGNQVRALCQELEKVLPSLRLRCWGIENGLDSPVLTGEAGRKTGLFLYQGGEREVFRGQVWFIDERDLKPVISNSDLSRAQFGKLYCRDGQCIADNTLIFAGGDHSIHKTHVGLSLGVELALQKLGIPYEACRGVDTIENCTVDFDGLGTKSPGAFFNAITFCPDEYHQ